MQNYYSFLGIEPSATEQEIHSAYRRLAKKYHPDSGSQHACTGKFRKLKEAYEALKCPRSRAKYQAHAQALNEIERFQIVARKNREMSGGDFSRTSFGYQGAQRRGHGNIIPFPKRKRMAGAARLWQKILRTCCDLIVSIQEELSNASQRRDDEFHRHLTRKLNRIPETEIGLRQAS